MKVKITKAFWFYALAMLICGRLIELSVCAVSAVLHEFAHAFFARRKGYKASKISLSPFGASLDEESKIRNEDILLIAVAGPAFSLSVAVISYLLAKIFTPIQSFLYVIASTNIVLAFFNLLPLYPLDGARIILSLSKKPIKTMRLLKKLSLISSVLFLALFIVSLFGSPNISTLIVAISLFFTAAFEDEYAFARIS